MSAGDGLSLTLEAAVADSLRQDLLAGLDADLPVGVDARLRQPLSVALRDAKGAIRGGLTGHTVWGWLVVELLWTAPPVRGSGQGRRLLAAAEAEAVRRGCHHARVDTYSFQAPGFYERCGYARFATLDDFPRGHQRHFYARALA
jgi:GNAT superfamily N-acetyltransferase